MTDRYAVIGNPVAHSVSPRIHEAFARQTGQDMTYGRILAPLDRFERCVREFADGGGRGLNVTLPFKLEAWRLATRLSARAEAARAVNTLRFDGDGVYGDNTDGAGLVRDIEANHGFAIAGRRVLVMGAGGAARGVLLPLIERGPATLAIANRTPEKAVEIARPFAARMAIAAGDYAGLAGREFDLVINATSASLAGAVPDLPARTFAAGALAYDMMYARELTAFLAWARDRGVARLADGYGMLVEQAAESFALWRGVRPSTRELIAELRAQ